MTQSLVYKKTLDITAAFIARKTPPQPNGKEAKRAGPSSPKRARRGCSKVRPSPSNRSSQQTPCLCQKAFQLMTGPHKLWQHGQFGNVLHTTGKIRDRIKLQGLTYLHIWPKLIFKHSHCCQGAGTCKKNMHF